MTMIRIRLYGYLHIIFIFIIILIIQIMYSDYTVENQGSDDERVYRKVRGDVYFINLLLYVQFASFIGVFMLELLLRMFYSCYARVRGLPPGDTNFQLFRTYDMYISDRQRRRIMNQPERAAQVIRELQQTYTDRKHGTIETKDCIICFDSFKEGDKIVQLRCNKEHIYHSDCIGEWVKKQAVCALCRQCIFPDDEEPEVVA